MQNYKISKRVIKTIIGACIVSSKNINKNISLNDELFSIVKNNASLRSGIEITYSREGIIVDLFLKNKNINLNNIRKLQNEIAKNINLYGATKVRTINIGLI